MLYKWLKVYEPFTDPDAGIRKQCHLGPHTLELIESGWDEEFLVSFNVYEWNSQTREWDELKINLKEQVYNPETSHTVLEDWYACNVLLEDHFGSADE